MLNIPDCILTVKKKKKKKKKAKFENVIHQNLQTVRFKKGFEQALTKPVKEFFFLVAASKKSADNQRDKVHESSALTFLHSMMFCVQDVNVYI